MENTITMSIIQQIEYIIKENQSSIYRKMAKSLEMDCGNLPELFKVYFGKENIKRLS